MTSVVRLLIVVALALLAFLGLTHLSGPTPSGTYPNCSLRQVCTVPGNDNNIP
jgi:hypothetical protein